MNKIQECPICPFGYLGEDGKCSDCNFELMEDNKNEYINENN